MAHDRTRAVWISNVLAIGMLVGAQGAGAQIIDPPGSGRAVINGAWLLRMLNDAGGTAALHVTGIGDSTWTAGGAAGFCPEFVALPQAFPILVSGWQECDLFTSLYAGPNEEHVVVDDASYDLSVFAPGEAPTATGQLGGHVGMVTSFAFNAPRAEGKLLRRYTQLDAGWFIGGLGPMSGRATVGRFLVLESPGSMPVWVTGRRGGSVVASALAQTGTETVERIAAFDVNCGAGVGPVGVELSTGPSASAGAVLESLTAFFLSDLDSPRGLYLDTGSIGGWSIAAWATAEGDSAHATTAYWPRVTDQAWIEWWRATAIPGAPRIAWILLGQNDGAFLSSERRGLLTTLVDRITTLAAAAGDPVRGIVVMSAPDPGPTLSERFDQYDQDAAWAAFDLSTASVPVCGIRMRVLFPFTGTVGGDIPGGLADTVHRSITGATEVMRRVYQRIIDEGDHCIADVTSDGVVDLEDFFVFLGSFDVTDGLADVNADGVVDLEDFFGFLNAFELGC